MRFFFFVCFSFVSFSVFAADRIKMNEGPDSELSVNKIVESLSEAANSEDLDLFISNFTEKRAKFIKDDLLEIFGKHIIEMSVIDSKIISQTNTRVVFDFKYFWSQKTAPFRQKISTKVTLSKEGNDWKIADSKIYNVERVFREQQQQQQFEFGGGGMVQFNPDDDEDALPSDIGRHNFSSCPGGRCNVK